MLINSSDIITTLYSKGIIKKICSNYYVGENLDDIAQDITIILLEQDEQIIKDLNKRDELIFYIKKIAKNQILSTSSNIYRKYKRYENNKVNTSDFELEIFNGGWENGTKI